MKKCYLLGFLLTLLLISCDKENYPTSLEIGDYYEFPIGRVSNILINGSGDYQITVADTSILNASYMMPNKLAVSPVTKGTTCLVICDKKTKAIAKTSVRIVDSYCCFQMGNPLRKPFLSNEYLFFIENESNDLGMFDKDFNLLNRGHYMWGKAEQYFTLRILFDKEYNGYKELNLALKNNGGLLQLIEDLFANQNSRLESRSNEIAPKVVNALDDKTGIEYYFVLEDKVLPYSFW